MTTSNIRKSIPIVRHKYRNILSGIPVNGPTNRPSNSRQLNRPATQTVRLKKNHGLIPSRNKGIEASQGQNPLNFLPDRLSRIFCYRSGFRALMIDVLPNAN